MSVVSDCQCLEALIEARDNVSSSLPESWIRMTAPPASWAAVSILSARPGQLNDWRSSRPAAIEDEEARDPTSDRRAHGIPGHQWKPWTTIRATFQKKPPKSEFTADILSGRWNVSDAQGKLIKDHADEYGIDVDKIFERSKK